MTAHIKVGGSFREIAGIHVHRGGAWREVAEGFVYKGGGWKAFYANEIIFINTANRTSANIYELMESPTKKGNYVFINRATIGASGASFALRTGTFPAGSTLHIINEGNIYGLSGAAGTAGSGVAGGHALYIDFPCTIDNGAGYIFGGGGGGGRGGNGGGGSYNTTVREPTSEWFYSNSMCWIVNDSYGTAVINWDGTDVASTSSSATSLTVGSITYHRGNHSGIIQEPSILLHCFSIARTYNVSTNSVGGAGGAGGRGQGSNASRTNGSTGANGGTNAGRGGTGGNGGDWGVAGGAGATGANGNRTNGVAGSPGGAAGHGIVKNNHAVSVISGSGTDRLKGGIV